MLVGRIQFLFFLWVFILAGTIYGAKPNFTPEVAIPRGKAVVYCYRGSRILGMAGSPEYALKSADTLYAGYKLSNGSYDIHVIDPGVTAFLTINGNSIRFNTQDGEVYYVEMKVGPIFVRRDAQSAFDTLNKCHLQITTSDYRMSLSGWGKLKTGMSIRQVCELVGYSNDNIASRNTKSKTFSFGGYERTTPLAYLEVLGNFEFASFFYDMSFKKGKLVNVNLKEF